MSTTTFPKQFQIHIKLFLTSYLTYGFCELYSKFSILILLLTIYLSSYYNTKTHMNIFIFSIQFYILCSVTVSWAPGNKELSKKGYVLRQSLSKMEMVCYNIQIRGSEIPKHMLMSVIESSEVGGNEDEGYF